MNLVEQPGIDNNIVFVLWPKLVRGLIELLFYYLLNIMMNRSETWTHLVCCFHSNSIQSITTVGPHFENVEIQCAHRKDLFTHFVGIQSTGYCPTSNKLAVVCCNRWMKFFCFSIEKSIKPIHASSMLENEFSIRLCDEVQSSKNWRLSFPP